MIMGILAGLGDPLDDEFRGDPWNGPFPSAVDVED